MAFWRPRRLLRSYILASLVMAFPKLNVPDPDGTVDRIQKELESLSELLIAVKGAVTSLRKRFQRLNLSDWQRGIQRTAERVGLVLCTDLVVAGHALAAKDSEAEKDLVDFSLSESYGALRSSLGLALD